MFSCAGKNGRTMAIRFDCLPLFCRGVTGQSAHRNTVNRCFQIAKDQEFPEERTLPVSAMGKSTDSSTAIVANGTHDVG